MSQNNILNHITSRIKADIEFLVAENLMSRYDADQAIAKLPTAADCITPVPESHQAVVHPSPAVRSPPPYDRAAPVAPLAPQRSTPKAKALWGYNENNEDHADLTFAEGDIIEITDETNADWWKGRYSGREGLFPSNYVEKITTPALPVRGQPLATSTEKATPVNGSARFAAPPPPGSNYNPNGAPSGSVRQGWQKPVVPPPAGLTEAPQQKNKFGKFGNQAASSAASGVGFGAGAAIGGGLVRAIF